MKRLLLMIIVITILLIGTVAVRLNGTDGKLKESAKPLVVTSFYPLYFLAQEIGGGVVEVVNITPAGAEPHDYELRSKERAEIENSELLLINGGGLEGWGERIDGAVRVGERVMDGGDPHVWLDPVKMIAMSEIVEDELENRWPDEKQGFRERGGMLRKRLEELDYEYKAKLASCKQREIITSHEAFSYQARRYGFTQTAISGMSPEEEPTATKLSQVADLVKEKNIKVVFFETLISPRLAETISRETGVGIAALNPIEGLTENEIDKGEDYLSVMRENLRQLEIALECKGVSL